MSSKLGISILNWTYTRVMGKCKKKNLSINVAVDLQNRETNENIKNKKNMKKLFIISVVLFSIISCTPETENGTVTKNELGIGTGDVTIYGVFDKNYIGLWDKEESITFDDYYSQIDTVLKSRVLSRNISYCYGENESVSVIWKVNGVVYSGVETKIWAGDWQKWVSKNSINFDISGITKNLEIEAIVTISGQNYRRFKTIPNIITNKHICDAFGLSFGTKQGDISGINAKSPTFAMANLLSETGSLTTTPGASNTAIFLEFSDSKLTKIHLLPTYSSDMDKFSSICHIPHKLTYKVDSNYHNLVIDSQAWNFGNLSFKVENVDYNPFLGISGNPEFSMFLTIQKQ